MIVCEIIEDDIVQVKIETAILVNHQKPESICCVTRPVATVQQARIIKKSF